MGIFSIPPDLPVTKSKEEIDKTYRYWRMHLMITSYIGYAIFYFTRKSFNFVMPAMLYGFGVAKIRHRDHGHGVLFDLRCF